MACGRPRGPFRAWEGGGEARSVSRSWPENPSCEIGARAVSSLRADRPRGPCPLRPRGYSLHPSWGRAICLQPAPPTPVRPRPLGSFVSSRASCSLRSAPQTPAAAWSLQPSEPPPTSCCPSAPVLWQRTLTPPPASLRALLLWPLTFRGQSPPLDIQSPPQPGSDSSVSSFPRSQRPGLPSGSSTRVVKPLP